jgi:hypothetical protein
MSRFEGVNWSEVDLDDCGRSTFGCQDPTSPNDLKEIAERKQGGNTFGDMNKKAEDEYSKKVRKKYIIYGLIAVAGYFAYKKFKK